MSVLQEKVQRMPLSPFSKAEGTEKRGGDARSPLGHSMPEASRLITDGPVGQPNFEEEQPSMKQLLDMLRSMITSLEAGQAEVRYGSFG